MVSTSKSGQGFVPICHCGGSGVLQGLVRRFYKAVIQRCAAPKKCLRHNIITRFCITNRHCEAGFSVGRRGTKCPSPQVGAGRYSGDNPNNPMLYDEAIQEKGSRNKCAMTNFGTFYQPHVIAEGEACPRSMDCFANARNEGKRHSEGAARRISFNKRSFANAQLCIQAHTSSLRCGGSLCKDDKKKAAFTLAEVLITLGIIGIVAAMTMPMLIAKYQKLVVETKLQVFYAQINDAFRRAHADYDGTFDDWVIKDKNYSYNEIKAFLETYLLPYVKYTKIKQCNNKWGQIFACVYFVNGTLMRMSIDNNGGDIVFHPNAKNEYNPREKFAFQMVKKKTQGSKAYNSVEFIKPYVLDWNGNRESLKTGQWGCYKGCDNCAYCTKWIQINGWKIPDDYPW